MFTLSLTHGDVVAGCDVAHRPILGPATRGDRKVGIYRGGAQRIGTLDGVRTIVSPCTYTVAQGMWRLQGDHAMNCDSNVQSQAGMGGAEINRQGRFDLP